MRRLRQPKWLKGGEVIIDIGSYIGADLVTFLRHAPSTVDVHTFEPVALYRTKLARRLRKLMHSGHAQLHMHAFGLGRSDHVACFANRAASTEEVHAMEDTSCESPSEIRDSAATIQRFARVDVMQVNCEGCEYDVLERLLERPAALKIVRSIEVQFHLAWGAQNDTSRYCHIESGLRSHGYYLEYRHPFLWERWSRRPCVRDGAARHGRGARESTLLQASTSCSMPWDRAASGGNASTKVRAVAVKHNLGFIGNKLFAIAAGVALAEATQLPLAIPLKSSTTMARKGFPCLRSSPSLRGLRRGEITYVRPNEIFGINFQDLSLWGTPDGSGLPLTPPRTSDWLNVLRRAFRPSAGGLPLAAFPASDDLVVHFRDLRDCGGWRADGVGGTRSAYRASTPGRWFYGLDLYAPPLEFFDTAITMHLARFGEASRVWLVSQPCDREHPTVKMLRSKWPMRLLVEHDAAVTCKSAPSCSSAVLDFIWLQAARHVVLSPSTFGWWSTFLSTRAIAIHFPIYPAFSPWGANMWCHLLPHDDTRYLFHDVWTNSTWQGGTDAGAGTGTEGMEARRRCDVYMRACLQARICAANSASAEVARHALPLGTIDDFTYLDNAALSAGDDLQVGTGHFNLRSLGAISKGVGTK